MKVFISEIMFNKMLKALTNGVAKDSYRPELCYIKIKVEGSTVTACSCDAYTGARMKFQSMSSEGDFECYIKPIPFKVSKSGGNMVTLSLEENVAVLEFPTEYGTLLYRFNQRVKSKMDLEKTFDGMKSHDREVGVNATLMARILRSLSSVIADRNKLVIIESKENNRLGFCIRAEEKDFAIEQFIMPVRIPD